MAGPPLAGSDARAAMIGGPQTPRRQSTLDTRRTADANLAAIVADFVLALDQGTSSSRAILFDRAGGPSPPPSRRSEQIYPQPGWVEHDAEEIWETQLDVGPRRAQPHGADASRTSRRSASPTSARRRSSGTATGRPIANAIVWQDRRTADTCEALRAAGLEPKFRERTGLLLDPYFSGTKVKWLLDNVPGARERAERGELMFGTVDSLAAVPPDAASTPPTTPTPPARCCTTSSTSAGTTSCWRRWTCRPRCCRRCGRRPACSARRRCSAARSRSPASPATSRRRSSGRPASRRAWRRTPTAPAPSC